jgi:hypothetical protein
MQSKTEDGDVQLIFSDRECVALGVFGGLMLALLLVQLLAAAL